MLSVPWIQNRIHKFRRQYAHDVHSNEEEDAVEDPYRQGNSNHVHAGSRVHVVFWGLYAVELIWIWKQILSMFCLKKRLRNGLGSSDVSMRYVERGREEEKTGEEDKRRVSTTSMDEAGVAPSPSASRGRESSWPALPCFCSLWDARIPRPILQVQYHYSKWQEHIGLQGLIQWIVKESSR